MVYVNRIHSDTRYLTGQWPFVLYCELFADDRRELEEFARSRLNINRLAWVTVKHHIPCYYLTVREREMSLKAGAIPLDRQQTVAWMKGYIASGRDSFAR